MNDNIQLLGLIVLVVLLIIIGPIATIWAWNILFGTFHTIELSLQTWAAVVVLGGFFSGSAYNRKK